MDQLYISLPTFNELDVYEFRLFSYYLLNRKLESQECSDTLAETANGSGISASKIIDCRKSLVTKGYIYAEPYFGGKTNRYRVTINEKYLQSHS